MSFMEPEVTSEMEWYECETSEGADFLPAELVGYVGLDEAGDVIDEDSASWQAAVRAVRPYLEGGRVYEVRLVRGYGARFSAPGYLDCTPWAVFDSESEAIAYLAEQVEDDADVA